MTTRELVTTAESGVGMLLVLNALAAPVGAHTPARMVIQCVAIVVTHLAYCLMRNGRVPGVRRGWLVGAQAACAFVPLATLGLAWGGMAGHLAAALLLFFHRSWRWALFALTPLTLFAWCAATGIATGPAVRVSGSTALLGLVMYGLTRLADTCTRTERSCQELVGRAVAAEQSRFSRDMHDVLGSSLTVITLRGELALSLLGSRPDQARNELSAIVDMARRATSDARVVAGGARTHARALSRELDSVVDVMRSMGVKTTIEASHAALPLRIDRLLAVVLRECAANILKHSTARRCRISVASRGGVVRVSVANDGVSPGDACPHHRGAGLGNIGARLAEAGGWTRAGLRKDGWFLVEVEVPVPVEAPMECAA
ncbi:sensor histidine kinase [Streptomyces sp. NPDC057702]|uniref:sensor histidine kinase n=1 Tax=unclassified Streptomyces TaxID=2593676 RepID=UPI003699617C